MSTIRTAKAYLMSGEKRLSRCLALIYIASRILRHLLRQCLDCLDLKVAETLDIHSVSAFQTVSQSPKQRLSLQGKGFSRFKAPSERLRHCLKPQTGPIGFF
jgi:hypothetical protein